MYTTRLRPAFTLLELLVVFATIGVLATLLFGVTQTLREQADKGKAISNVRYVGMAVLNYMQEDPKRQAPGAGPLGITAEYTRTGLDSDRKTLGAALASYLGNRPAQELTSNENHIITQLLCPRFEHQFPAQNHKTPHYVQNYTLTQRKSGEYNNPRVLGDQNRPDDMPPIQIHELDEYGGPSRVWILTNLDMRLPYDNPRMFSKSIADSGWFTPTRIPAEPIWGQSRLRLYFDGSVAFVPHDADP